MVLGKADAERVVLVAGALLIEQEADLNLFYITKHQLLNTNRRHRRGVAMEITFKRKIMSEMMTTYFPSVLLMLITFATTFFKPEVSESHFFIIETRMRVSQASRQDREKISANLGHRDEFEIYYLHSQASRRV